MTNQCACGDGCVMSQWTADRISRFFDEMKQAIVATQPDLTVEYRLLDARNRPGW